MLEKELENKLVKKVKSLGGRAYKFVSPGNAGVPDRLVVLPGGRVGFAEMKRDKNHKPTQLQLKQITFLMRLNCFVQVIDSEEAIDAFLIVLQNQKKGDKKWEYQKQERQ